MKTALIFLICAASAFSDNTWITSVTPGSTRNDGPYAAGLKFMTGSSVITLTQLGRYCFTGNSGVHTVYVVDASGATVLASAPVNMAGCAPGTFAYAPVSLTLAPDTLYFLLSAEPGGGDTYGNSTSTLTTSSDATDVTNAYSTSIPPSGVNSGSIGQTYIPVNFQYTGGGGGNGGGNNGGGSGGNSGGGGQPVAVGFPVVY